MPLFAILTIFVLLNFFIVLFNEKKLYFFIVLFNEKNYIFNEKIIFFHCFI